MFKMNYQMAESVKFNTSKKTKQNKTTIMDNIITFVSFCSSVKIVLFSSYQQQPQLVSCCKICTDIKERFSKLPKKKPIAIRFLFSFV